MKAVRYSAAFLLLVSGVLHLLLALQLIDEPNSLPILVFGIFYFIVGLLLIFNMRFAPLFGIIFPLIGLVTGIFVIGIPQWNLMLSFLFFVDAVVVICCIFCHMKNREQV